MEIVLGSFFSYFMGSIPFGLLLTKIFSNKDIRKIGSGNIGATNVLRSGNKSLAIFTLLLDLLKGFLPVLTTQLYFSEYLQISCLLAFLGHVFPIWLKFKGGKGVATFLGILFALSIQLALLFIFTWLVLALIFRYSSLSSMFATFTVFIVAFIKDGVLDAIDPNLNSDGGFNLILFILFILIIFTHKKNISNLKNKTEQKIKI